MRPARNDHELANLILNTTVSAPQSIGSGTIHNVLVGEASRPALWTVLEAYCGGSTVMVDMLHSPALVVQACGARSLLKQIRASCNDPLVHEVRNAPFGKPGLAASNLASISAGLHLTDRFNEANSGGILTESRAFRTAAK